MPEKMIKEFTGKEILSEIIKECEEPNNSETYFKGGRGKFKLIKNDEE